MKKWPQWPRRRHRHRIRHRTPNTELADALISALAADGDGAISSDELKVALQAGRERNTDSSTDQSNVTEALNKMIANLSKQYSLDNVATVGKYLNVAT